ncbi:MAG: radical SAM family heme chaperone HemW [Lachnospiraceae bacterium]|jgi:oxygen-independent coproporphyrinogen-3 oxidase|nr:radical SAM family heme chaperone HemW [Lachnospiraceae bacterium]MCI9589281.1 radical SAM family heme chaperone HemW [Lachnospiraceae bacterium]
MMNKKKPLELYVHIPFCARKCLYCDFLSFRTLASVHQEYIDQLLGEIQAASLASEGYQVTTIFIGGGTPSILEAGMMRAVVETIRLYFDVAPDAEITIEANPGTLTAPKLDVYRGCGINRLSMGLQSADNRELKALGRVHSFEEFLKSFERARQAGFWSISVDLMSALPGQTLESWKNTLKKVAMLKPEHISAYSLIIEENTPFWDYYGDGPGCSGAESSRGSENGQSGFSEEDHPQGDSIQGDSLWRPLPDEETERKMYKVTKSFLESQGYQRYEISNYAKPGFECRHNIGYWTGAEYLGLGLGASSCFHGARFSNETDLKAYLELDFLSDGLIKLYQNVEEQTRQSKMEEFMFLGLRMTEGVSDIDFAARFGVKIRSIYGPKVDRLIENGLLREEGSRIFLTDWGIDISNYVLSEFLLE